jgi:hypothetical protein
MGGELHVHHILNGVIHVTSNDGSGPRCHEVNGYLHPNLRIVQVVSLKRMTSVDGNGLIVAKSNERIQQHLRESRAVSARGPKTTVRIDHEGITNPLQPTRKKQ